MAVRARGEYCGAFLEHGPGMGNAGCGKKCLAAFLPPGLCRLLHGCDGDDAGPAGDGHAGRDGKGRSFHVPRIHDCICSAGVPGIRCVVCRVPEAAGRREGAALAPPGRHADGHGSGESLYCVFSVHDYLVRLHSG